jgi:transcriptional regulator with XRE-family HTH domain
MTIATTIAALRRERGLSLRALARMLGVSHVYVSKLEHGLVGVSAEQAARLATALGADAAEFVRLALQERLDAAGVVLTVRVEAGWSDARHAFEGDCRTLGEPFVEGEL